MTAAMLLASLAFLLLGALWSRAPAARGLTVMLAALVFAMAMLRGFYWHVFPRGTGFFTANRISAILLFALAFAAPNIAFGRIATRFAPQIAAARRDAGAFLLLAGAFAAIGAAALFVATL